MTASPSEGEHGLSPDHPLTDIVDRMADTAQGERVTVGETLEAFGRRSYLPLLIVPSLAVMSPLSGVPLMSSLCGAVIAIISAQMIFPGLGSLWIPDIVARRNVSGRRARAAIGKLGKIARWMDDHAQVRLKWLIEPPGRTALECVCLLCGLAMPFLEFIPFSSSVAGAAVLLIAGGLLTRDGLFALAGLAVIPIFGALLAIGLETLGLAGG
ncbi:exopolysaccharide biosynthesis protein [Thalassobaculum sp. OXR-137]|uniref:exopolysaccharide biosynthesis protein n=1 Tax=Thalassobaculum sp. OXR-137 TaxID=3100173 RepID=UPI002AC9AED2|nr:exopolysaccharide biosynthesis protein [Thalassobaculum sp. OXR-137]WPZ34496.1 exopolysaccharide biosynthesis protein [Thalassobaculum sp. OXR-137]